MSSVPLARKDARPFSCRALPVITIDVRDIIRSLCVRLRMAAEEGQFFSGALGGYGPATTVATFPSTPFADTACTLY